MTEVLWVRIKAVVPYRGLNDSMRFLDAKGGKSHPHGDLHMDAPLDGTKLTKFPLHDVSTGRNAVDTSFTMTIWKRRIAARLVEWSSCCVRAGRTADEVRLEESWRSTTTVRASVSLPVVVVPPDYFTAARRRMHDDECQCEGDEDEIDC